MKSESLVIVNQHVTVNLYLSLVLSARHTREVRLAGSSRMLTRTALWIQASMVCGRGVCASGEVCQGGLHDRSEVVTR
jgi:hypothetical protein